MHHVLLVDKGRKKRYVERLPLVSLSSISLSNLLRFYVWVLEEKGEKREERREEDVHTQTRPQQPHRHARITQAHEEITKFGRILLPKRK